MISRLLSATAAIALLAGTSIAFAQQEPPRGAPAEKISPKAPATAPSAPPAATHSGSMERNEPKKTTAEERGEPSRAQVQPRQEQNQGKNEATKQTPSRDEQNRASGDNKLDQNRTVRDNGRADEHEGGREERRETTGQGAGATHGTAANIKPEHKTQIHDIIIKERAAPRVDHVDFSVSVGTAVPRTVRLAAVPRQIIEIEPEWRGFEYFMIGDRIVIVNPRSLEIVAVLDV